jgi:hypothetical protein
MFRAGLSALIACAFAALPIAGQAEALEPPTVQAALRIVQEKGGACAELRAGGTDARPALVMSDVCHGWSASACDDMLFVEAHPVIEAQAQVLFMSEDRAIDLVPLIDQAVARRWPGQEHLHLAFEAPRCEDGGLVAPFTGSRVKRDVSGPATALKGRLVIDDPTRQAVLWDKP